MTRLAKTPLLVPKGVEVKVEDKKVTLKGTKGTISYTLADGISLKIDDEGILIERDESLVPEKAMLGLYRAILKNLILGVTAGFEKKLQLIGVGFRAQTKGNKLDLQLGFSHPMEIEIPNGLEVKVNKSTEIVITGLDKQLVGQFAATVRAKRPPEPYKGKGIRYLNEYVRKKAGKAAKSK